LAAAACLSIILITWAGYTAVREWQNSVLLLAERQADDAARRFLSLLMLDMQAVQRQVLLSPALDVFTSSESPLDPSYETANLVAGAFARYSYPESFFLWAGGLRSRPAAFFYRRDRRPLWSKGAEDPGRYPVVIDDHSPIAERVLTLLRRDETQVLPFVVLETTVDGVPYQIVARLFRRDPLRQDIDVIFGFMVNLTWARQYYYADLLQQALRDDSSISAAAISVFDDEGRSVVASGFLKEAALGASGKRAFYPLFFNPLLVATQPPSVQPRRLWTIQTAPRQGSSLFAAATAANSMLVLQILAAVTLAAGVILGMRAARSSIRLSKLRSEFIASVTHEFKNPIATIRAAGETLAAGRLDAAGARQDYARYIVQESRRLARLVDNLLAFSRLTDSEEVQHLKEPVVLAEVVGETIERFSVQLSSGEFEVNVSLPDDLPLVWGDSSAIALMLDNLIDNAIRHSRTEHRLAISARSEASEVRLDVTDRGGGIPQDEIPHVTKRFFRGRHAGHGGTGLGLAIAKRIISDHGGSLDVKSEVGIGTSVRISLPAITGHGSERAHSGMAKESRS
jgi:signal transduction histidine kinase